MTRWARVGNSQKHQKLPEDATPWKDFWQNKTTTGNVNKNKVLSGRIEKKKQKLKFDSNVKRKISEDLDVKNISKFRNVKQEVSEHLNIADSSESQVLSKKQLRKAKKKAKLQQLQNVESNDEHNNAFNVGAAEVFQAETKSPDFNKEKKNSGDLNIRSNFKFTNTKQEVDESNLNTTESTESQVLSKKQLRKAKKKAKLQKLNEERKISYGLDIKNNFELKNVEQESVGNLTSSNFSLKNAKEVNEQHLNITESTESQVLSKKQLRKAKKKAKLQKLSEEGKISYDLDIKNNFSLKNAKEVNEEHLNITESTESQVPSKKQLKKAKLQQLKNVESSDKQDYNTSNSIPTKEVVQANIKLQNENDFQGNKELFMRKLKKKRMEIGIMLLPAKVERRLYIIKKRLREKGLSSEAIKEIARKERRKEELKFRRSVSNKPCFNCRQIGHLLAECPVPLGNSNQETGICFKCGSPEHTSYKCPEEIKGYPLAKCFVCKEQGHISKDCPKNEHGVYIKGGKCSLCGNVNHLKKDCPTLRSKKGEEADITAYTINEGKSVDAEIIPEDDRTDGRTSSIKNVKKAKVVKF